tara:strand:- start:2284 stop:2394 length:111 start_codon:yes stop_codon:yes gene_type:complete
MDTGIPTAIMKEKHKNPKIIDIAVMISLNMPSLKPT